MAINVLALYSIRKNILKYIIIIYALTQHIFKKIINFCVFILITLAIILLRPK